MSEVFVNNGGELATEIGNGSTHIHLNAASFIMSTSVTIDYDCIIDITYHGNVTINMGDTHSFTLDDSGSATEITIGDVTGTNRLTFSRGATHTLTIQSSSADIVANFYHCSFINAALEKGLLCPTNKGG